MKSAILILLILFLPVISSAQTNTLFSKEEVLEDLVTLRTVLEQAQYNMYAYTPEREFDSVYTRVKNSITLDSLSLLETTNLYQQVVAALNIGHTSVNFPISSYRDYAMNGGTLFPLEIAFEDGIPRVRKNWTDNESIATGAEVVSINNQSMDEILSQIYPVISAERPMFKNVKMELFSFPRYYWQVFGRQDEFEVVIRSGDELVTHHVSAVDVIEGYETRRTEIYQSNRELRFYEEAAYVNPGAFSGDETQFQHFIDSAFVEIKEKGSENLIVDFRNNSGGDNSFSDYLVSYFAYKPFKWNSSFSLQTSGILKEHVRQKYDTTDAYWRAVLDHEDGEVYEYNLDPVQPQPLQKRFRGNVFVLINRQSHSQSAVAAAQIQDDQFGTIVGEETGEYPSLYASIFTYSLPNTGIPVNLSKGYIVRVNGSTAEQGVIPDIFIKDYLLDEEDEILEGLLQRLR